MGETFNPLPPRKKSAAYNAKEKLTVMEIEQKQYEIKHHQRMIQHHKQQLKRALILVPTIMFITFMIGIILK